MAARRASVGLALLWLAVAALPGGPAPVRAATYWSIALSPMTLTEGVPTNVTVTITAGNDHLGCVALNLPAGFTVVSAGVSIVPTGYVWSSAGGGAGPTQVTFSTTTDPWRLKQGAIGVFIVRVIATASPLPAWSASAYEKFTVDSSQLTTGPLVQPLPLVILPAPTATPTSASTSTPTLIPTSTPTPRATSTATAQTTLTPTSPPTATLEATPTLQHGATAMPTEMPTTTTTPPQATPGATRSTLPDRSQAPSPPSSTSPPEMPSAFASPDSVANGAAMGGPKGSGGPAAGAGTNLDIAALPAGGSVQLDAGAVGAIGMYAWLVPGLFLSLPGLLLMLIVLAQASFASAFVPITRRVFGAGRQRRGRNRSVLPR